MKKNIIDFPKDKKISPELKDLIINTLNEYSNTRLTIEDIVKHPFYNSKTQKIHKHKEGCCII